MRTIPIACGALLSSACGLFNSIDNGINNGIQGATATHLTVVTMLQSPPVPALPQNPTATVATIFFGNRPTETTLTPDPVNGATVTITDDAGVSVVASATDAGVYYATSTGGSLRYDPNATYGFTFVDDAGVIYTAAGSAPPQETVAQFSNTFQDDGGLSIPVFAEVTHGNSFTITRDPPPGSTQLDVAFVAVFSVAGGQQSGNATWTNAPQTPQDFLNLIVNDGQWRTATVNIPGSAFPSPGIYLVTLTAIREGKSTSNDLFSGSAILLGSATAGIVEAN